MLAALHDSPAVYYQNLVGALDCGQPVRDDNQGLVPDKLIDGFLDILLVVWVNASSGLVQQDNRRVLEDCPRYRYALLLSTGKC